MAGSAHCAYCFESLAARLEDREPLEYHQILDRWAQWESSQNPGNPSAEPRAEEDAGHPTNSADAREDTEYNQNHLIEGIAHPKPVPAAAAKTGLQLPSMSRLQVPSPASASSASSTPSSPSAASSSTTALGDKSKSSSNSSFFSFGRSKQPSPSPAPPQDSSEQEHPLFVTWNTLSPTRNSSHKSKSLRGCIGTFEPHPLHQGLREYALTAAFDDTRFAPISLGELAGGGLSCSVTFLTNFTPCGDAYDWELGVHGIRIAFAVSGKRYGATYLPDVALEQGWNKEETLISLMRKAGWGGRSRDFSDIVGKLSVTRYEGKKASLDYAEWQEWRQWAAR